MTNIQKTPGGGLRIVIDEDVNAKRFVSPLKERESFPADYANFLSSGNNSSSNNSP